MITEFKNVSKEYQDSTGYRIRLFENLSFGIENKKITTIAAPKGTGKSSLLKLIDKIEAPSSGEITNAFKKSVLIPSQPSSFPWYSVSENLRVVNPKIEKSELQNIIHFCGLTGYEDHYPDNNSIGFRLRISIGRAMAAGADMLLLDEPFSKIPNKIIPGIYQLILKLKEKGMTIVLATTNISEAVMLSDKIILFSKDPCKIIEEIDINISGGRDENLFADPEFHAYREKIEKMINARQPNSMINFTV